jgi:predicted phosphodiesterase
MMKRKELFLIICSVIGALVFLFIAAPTTNHQLTAFRFSLRLLPGSGFTKMELPPVGSIGAKTHWAPWDLVLTLQSIDLDGLQQLLATPGSKDILLTTLFALKPRLLCQFLLKAAAIAALGGAWGCSWVQHGKRDFLRGSVVGIVVVLGIALITSFTYDPQGFANPVYSGALKGAPWALGLAQNAWDNWNGLGNNVSLFVQNLRQVMAKATSQPPPEKLEHDFKILHVSDLHNNPLAIDFISEVSNNFQPNIIIDTGDLTDFGTTVEEDIVNRLSTLKTPYYLVLGNHDSPIVADKIKNIASVTLLNGLEQIGDLWLMGAPDPASSTNNIAPASSEQISTQVNVIQSWLLSAEELPFILAVHDPRIAQPFIGKIPIILTGHTHTSCIEVKDQTVFINAGTTGGAGLRGLLGEKEVALTAVLLYIDTTGSTPVLDAVDNIRLYPRENRFELTRTANL